MCCKSPSTNFTTICVKYFFAYREQVGVVGEGKVVSGIQGNIMLALVSWALEYIHAPFVGLLSYDAQCGDESVGYVYVQYGM